MCYPMQLVRVCLLVLIAVSSTGAFSSNIGLGYTKIHTLRGGNFISSHLNSPFDIYTASSSHHPRLSTVSCGAAETSSETDPIRASLKKEDGKRISKMYSLAGILSAMAWITTACVALSYHPDPKFADCTIRHNVLTMSQAFAFPLPVAWACFEALRKSAKNCSLDSNISRRLNLGIAVASFWLAASSIFPTIFAFGYDLYSLHHKVAAAAIHATTGVFALMIATKNSTSSSMGQIVRSLMDSLWNLGPTPGRRHRNSSSYATGTVGLLYFTIQPIVATYPLATIPTILGKRLSRPASAFTLLGSILAYCLKEKLPEPSSSLSPISSEEQGGSIYNSKNKQEEINEIRTTLRRGLAWGTAGHLFLIFLKLIGVDGGGLIFPGRGLWEVYPAMISVPFAAGVSLAVHAILCFAAWTDRTDKGEQYMNG